MGKVILKNVTKRFGNLTAVDRLDLEIKDGEMVVLVGPSGCGKSTTLRMIAGLEEVSGGEITIDGKVVNNVAPKDRDIAMVFQNYALYPHMNVYDNIAFGLKLRKVPRDEIERRVSEAAELLGIKDKLRARPGALSGGQRQRVAVGRAIVREPEVFLFDEPLSNLDAKLRVHMRAELQELHRRLQTTTIYVTHDQVEAMTLGTRVAVLEGGVLQQVDTPQRLYDYPANVFVAGFIGSPSMNFLKAELVEKDGRVRVQGEGFDLLVPENRAEQVREHAGREVILGIRPEDFWSEVTEDGAGGEENRITLKVSVIEPLGNVQLVRGDVGDTDVTTELDPGLEVSIDEELSLIVNTEKLHFFDPETEDALLKPPAEAEEPVAAAD